MNFIQKVIRSLAAPQHKVNPRKSSKDETTEKKDSPPSPDGESLKKPVDPDPPRSEGSP